MGLVVTGTTRTSSFTHIQFLPLLVLPGSNGPNGAAERLVVSGGSRVRPSFCLIAGDEGKVASSKSGPCRESMHGRVPTTARIHQTRRPTCFLAQAKFLTRLVGFLTPRPSVHTLSRPLTRACHGSGPALISSCHIKVDRRWGKHHGKYAPATPIWRPSY
jgi:hypothetical protein